jgi:cytochrome b561
MARDPQRYTTVAIVLHWLIAAAVAFQVYWGWTMQSLPKGAGTVRVDAFNLHKSVGIAVLLLMVARLVWRLTHRPPALPASVPEWQHRAAALNHGLLYVLAIAQPLTGLLGSAYSGFPIRFFGIRLPSLVQKSEAAKELLSELHLWLSWLLVALIALHVAAALKHALVDRDGLLRRMLPGG